MLNSQKAMSLPSSPHEYRSQTSERSEYVRNDELVSTWNRILESPMFQNKPLIAYSEWNIDFSELTVGTRVGIGKHTLFNILCSSLNFQFCDPPTTILLLLLFFIFLPQYIVGTVFYPRKKRIMKRKILVHPFLNL